MSRAALLWHLLLPVICVVSPLNGRASCDEQWREGLNVVRARAGIQVIDENGHNASTIPPAILHAALKDHWLDHYKTKLLKDLNMQSAPEPGSRRLPKSIKHQLEMIKAREGQPLNQEFDECPPSTSKSEHVRDVIAQAPRPHGNRQRPVGWGMLDSKARPVKRVVSSTINEPGGRFIADPKRSYFNLNGIRDSDITNATLYLHVQRPPSRETDEDTLIDELQVHIYKYLNDTHVMLEPVVFRKFQGNFSGGGWLAIGMARLVNQWAQNPSRNYGVMIKAEMNGHDYLNRTVDESNRTSSIILAMDMDESSSVSSRLPASPAEEMTCNADDQDNKCCRYPLEINFEAFGWDWVIAPKRYNAYYCAGTCPVNFKQMSPHAHLMQQLDFLSSATTSQRRSLGPCCTPQDYQDVKVIYIAQDRSIRETLIPGAIVLRCGCA